MADRIVRELTVLSQYRDAIRDACGSLEDPFLLAAIMARETWYGLAAPYHPKGSPDGVGDFGHGHGLMQIDDRGPYAGLIRKAPWPVVDQVRSAIKVLEDARIALRAWRKHDLYERAVIATYNTGARRVIVELRADCDPDCPTTNHDYGSWVLEKRAALAAAAPRFFATGDGRS